MIEVALIVIAAVAVIVALVHDPDADQARPVSLESPSASRAPASVERARR